MDEDARPRPVPPLSSQELEADARKAGVASDEATRTDGDTHLPASESRRAADGDDGKRKPPEESLTKLPPG